MIENRGEDQERKLERIMRIIPGYSGYKDKEHIRESDKRLREYLGTELDRHRKTIERVMRELTDMKVLGFLDDIDRQVKRMHKYADTIRFASYGYAGFFSEVKIREQELNELYTHDLTFTDNLQEINVAVEAIVRNKSDYEQLKTSIGNLETVLDSLDAEIQKRSNLFR